MPTDREVFIIHRIPGRVRIGVGALRRDPARAEQIAEMARECPSVVDARVSPWAACLVVEHEPDAPIGAVLDELARIPELACCGGSSIDDLAPPCAAPAEPPSPGRTARLVRDAAVRLNAASQVIPPPQVDLTILVPCVLVGSGLLQALMRRAPDAPHWITLIKYGVDAFVLLNHDRLQSLLASPGAPEGGETGR
ncbi:hypothetical protein WMF31_30395 [Sorangium sp. So ce1036]|uniref:hypothetical protein n=1 Tax=Sorangium sp. So ce1036 TaxID=3133328 RepID=UPI003EFDBA8E